MPTATDDLEFLQQASLNPHNIPDVLRLQADEIDGVEYQRTFEYGGVMVMQVALMKKPKGRSVAVRCRHRFVVVGQDNNKINDLVTAYLAKKRLGFYHGVTNLISKNARFQDDMLWTTGLNLVWKYSPKNNAQYKKASLIHDRMDLVKKLCEVIQVDEDDEEHDDWEIMKSGLRVGLVVQLSSTLSLTLLYQKIIDSHEKFTNLENGIIINPPSGYLSGASGKLQKTQHQPSLPVAVQNNAQRATSPSRKRQRSVPFVVDMFNNLGYQQRQTAGDLWRILEGGVLEFEQSKKEEFVRLITLAYPWKPLSLGDFEGYRESRDRDDAFRLTDFLPFENWWRAAQHEVSLNSL